MKQVPVFFMACFLFYCCKSNDGSIKPIHKDLIQAVYASGKIYPVNYVRIAAKTNGYVSKLLVKTGDTVKAGEPLIVLSAPNNDVNIDVAKTNLQLSEAYNRNDINQLNAALQDINTAAAKYSLDSTNYERYKNLWNQNITTQQNLDNAKTQADISRRTLIKAKSSYENLKTKLSADVSLAQKQLQFQQNNKTDYTIVAPFSGKVYDVPVKEGQLLTAGMVAIDFGDTKKFEADLDIDETDIGMIMINQPVIISCDAFPGKPVNTSIREIDPALAQGRKTITAKAFLTADSIQFYSGMSAEANIIISKKQNALVIPAEYLGNDNMVLKKDKTKQKVQTGARDIEYVEILSGIDENTELIKPE
jgi:HlyD family secretion protein